MSRDADNTETRVSALRRPAVGYVRVSTLGQGNDGISLDAQRKGIKAFADEMDYALIEILEDVASTVGEQSFHNRRSLQDALELAARKSAVLIVWDWDRLSRHFGFVEQVQKLLSDKEQIICAKEGTSLREASRNATFLHRELIAKEISRRTKEGMARRRDAGAVFGNPDIATTVQPLGTAAHSSAANEIARRIADVLRELDDPFEMSYWRICEKLNEKGIRTLHGKE